MASVEIAEALTATVEVDRRPEPGAVAKFLRGIPLPRGPLWYLVAYRWFLVAVCLFTVAVTWNVWQDRSDPNWRAWWFATPTNPNPEAWKHRPPDSELVPMLPVWDWLPQFSVGWLLVGSLAAILVFPRAGLAALFVTMVLSVLMDQMRLQPHYLMAFLIMATLPGAGAQLIGRVNLVALWFWAGFHKFIFDFIKPADAWGFTTDMIPRDMARLFPPDRFTWNTHALGVAVGWTIAISEMLLGICCFIPPLRWVVAFGALGMHLVIIWWNCWSPRSNLIGWNIALALAGFVLIVPWRERAAGWRACHPLVRGLAIFMFVYPAAYYIDWVPAYLSHCLYVPNNACGQLFRPGEPPRWVGSMCYDTVNFPLTPSHKANEQYFEKIKRPGDVLVIADPRPWAQARGLNGRRLTYSGELRDGVPNGHWVRRDMDGGKLSEGDFDHGVETGRWTFWYPSGQKAMEGDFSAGQPDGEWTMWMPGGQEMRVTYDHGQMVRSTEAER